MAATAASLSRTCVPTRNPVRLLAADQESLGACLVDLLCNPFKADQQVAIRLHLVAIGDATNHFGRNESFYHVVIGRECARGLSAGEHILGQQSADLVPREDTPWRAECAGGRRRATQSVGIGIGRENQFRARLVSTLDQHVERCRILRIGDVPRHVGEVSVRISVLGEDFHFFEAGGGQHRANARRSHAMHRRVKDLQIPGARKALGLNPFLIGRVGFVLAVLDLTGCQRLVERNTLDRRDVHHALDYSLIVRRQ